MSIENDEILQRHGNPYNHIENAVVNTLRAGNGNRFLPGDPDDPDAPEKNYSDYTSPGEKLIKTARDDRIPEDGEIIRDPLIRCIHPKIRRDEKGEPEYFEDEVPVVGVYCPGKEQDDRRQVKISRLPVNIVLDIVNFGGYISIREATEPDSTVKLIAGRIEQYLRHIGEDHSRDSCPDGIFSVASQITEIGASIFEPAYMSDKGWVFEGGVSFQVTILTRG